MRRDLGQAALGLTNTCTQAFGAQVTRQPGAQPHADNSPNAAIVDDGHHNQIASAMGSVATHLEAEHDDTVLLLSG
eukprot:354971-Pyramimonas_sp.AAC.1